MDWSITRDCGGGRSRAPIHVTRREILRVLLASPLAGCGHAVSRGGQAPVFDPLPVRSILAPASRAVSAVSSGGRVIDVHAHFFNASDVPVRGFIAECLGHRATFVARQLLRALAPLADRIAASAPTADEEIEWLRSLLRTTEALAIDAAHTRARDALGEEREPTAERVAEVIRGSEFERLYRRFKSATVPVLSPRAISGSEILAIVSESEAPSSLDVAAATQPTAPDVAANIADGILGFLYYMLGYRSMNVDAYIAAYRRHEGAFGIDMVLGSLVDFDRWLERPPRSAHDRQIELHALLAQMHGGFLRPIAAYNPWTDVVENGAALQRVVHAVRDRGFVGVKIYPPTGFMPAGNATTPVKTKKRRPDLRRLDAVIETFFTQCAELRVPVIAHANRSNGRDDAHDEFSSPAAWRAVIARYATRAKAPVIDVGHFGGGAGSDWTKQFAALMGEFPAVPLFGDLGYWDELMCGAGDNACAATRARLKEVLGMTVGTQAVADRVMFGSDWLMLAQVKKWADYPAKLHASIASIASPEVVAKIFGGNAERCFALE